MGRTEYRFSNASGIAVAQAKASAAHEAAADIARQLPSDGLAMVLVFLSPYYDPHEFIAEMAGFLGSTPVFGCTTAGELAPDGWGDNSVVALGFGAEDFSIVARPLPDLSNFRVEDGRRIGTELRHESARRSPEAVGQNSFGLLLIDGLCRREEAVMSAIYASLDNIPVVGGSAGDGLRFEKTWVFYDGQAHSDAAILIILKTALPFRLFKCDNFEPTTTKMVVTEADVERRVVKEINAEPAAEEYSRGWHHGHQARCVLVRLPSGAGPRRRSVLCAIDPANEPGRLPEFLLRDRRRDGSHRRAATQSDRGDARSVCRNP